MITGFPTSKPPFKVGDRVKVISNFESYGNRCGAILTIKDIRKYYLQLEDRYMCDFVETPLSNFADELELYDSKISSYTVNKNDTHYPTVASGQGKFATTWYDETIDRFWGTDNSDKELLTNKKTMSITQKFRNLFRTEPFKTLNKVGLTNSENQLTDEGEIIFLNWLLVKHAEEFKTEVGEKLVEDTK